MKQRIASWWQRIIADPGQVEKCLKCRRRFRDKEPGAWTSYRDFPELCNSMCDPRRRSHVNCRACGPYCPQCAAATEQELLAIRKAHGG